MTAHKGTRPFVGSCGSRADAGTGPLSPGPCARSTTLGTAEARCVPVSGDFDFSRHDDRPAYEEWSWPQTAWGWDRDSRGWEPAGPSGPSDPPDPSTSATSIPDATGRGKPIKPSFDTLEPTIDISLKDFGGVRSKSLKVPRTTRRAREGIGQGIAATSQIRQRVERQVLNRNHLRVRIVIIERAGIIDEASQLHTQNPGPADSSRSLLPSWSKKV
jgi:hypothetical protein